ncbi:MAG: hypothetical protein BGN86_11725 [Caulobacterales bacterium 68-7]|nr:MAG: hypothetical protein BGN86_11725 [Caulobacterales bacterium 68-7]
MYQLMIWFPGDQVARSSIPAASATAAMDVLPDVITSRPRCDRVDVCFGETVLFTARPRSG